MFYHFLDESGDPGINQSGTSSTHFVLSMVQLATREQIPELAAVRQKLNLPPSYEFKYYRSQAWLKLAFFEAIASLPFLVRTIILDKANAPHHFQAMRGPELTVELFVGMVRCIPETEIHNHILIIDGATVQLKRNIRKRLSQMSRETNRKRPFKKIISQNSNNSDGLQLADMVAGTIRQYATAQNSRYFHLIQNKFAGLWHIPIIK